MFNRLLGPHKLIAYVLNEWLTDIKKNQLPSVMAGVGPMHSIVQLGMYTFVFTLTPTFKKMLCGFIQSKECVIFSGYPSSSSRKMDGLYVGYSAGLMHSVPLLL